jgi:hypothetical protein
MLGGKEDSFIDIANDKLGKLAIQHHSIAIFF